MSPATSSYRAVTRSEGALEQGWRMIRRRKLAFLQALVIVPLLALGFSLTQEKEYTASATLLFRESPLGLLAESGTEAFVDPARAAATNDVLVVLPVVADEAVQLLEDEGIRGVDVYNSVSVDSGGEADVATISATATSPQLAAEIANAYGAAYIQFRQRADRSQVESAIDLVEQSLEELTPEARAGEQGQSLEDRLDRLELARLLQTGKAELVQPATPPAAPSSPKTLRNIFLGLMLGAGLGLALAALPERIDRRIRTEEELEEIYRLPLLARIPRSRWLGGGWLRGRKELEQTPELEAFRTLRVNLSYFNVDGGARSILVASPEPGDGKSTVARHLAMTMAEMGDSVVLVEADLHKGQPLVAGEAERGLSSVLAGTPLDLALMEVETTSTEAPEGRVLTVLPSGSAPPNPSELLESERMRGIIAELHNRFDVVIVDSPALGVVSDTLALVPAVGTVVVVSGLGTTTRDGARNFMKQLAIIGVEPAGVIANFTKAERGGYAYYQRSAVARS